MSHNVSGHAAREIGRDRGTMKRNVDGERDGSWCDDKRVMGDKKRE